MQFADVLCYIFLTITVTTSCIEAEDQNEVEESQLKRISKREATLMLENYPLDRIFQKPKVIYRRMSKQGYGPPKSKYGPPRPKYRPPKVSRKPAKKNNKTKVKPFPKPTSKYIPPKRRGNKKHSKPKPKYGPPQARPVRRPGFGHVLKMNSYVALDQVGFGEPPSFLNDYSFQKQRYGEPPVDSYGAPLRTSIKDVISTPQSFRDTSQHHDVEDYTRQENWNHRHTQNPDTNYAFTNKQPTYSAASHKPVFVTPTPIDYNEESLDPDPTEKQIMQDNNFFFRKKKPFYVAGSKVVNKPWTPNKQNDVRDDLLVGGQYAEPPARYVKKFAPYSQMYGDDDDEDTFISPMHGYVDTDVALSASNSPYSNYKHSNMAFSPQNLNDVFSIVDRK